MTDDDLNLRCGQFLLEHFPGTPPEQIRRTEELQVDQCYENVRSVVRARGGEPVWGWSLRIPYRRWLEACHHAVWRDPSGELHEVTKQTDGEGQTTFIRDTTIAVSDSDPIICSKFMALDNSAGTAFWIAGNIERMQLMARTVELLQSVPHQRIPGGLVPLGAPPPEFLELNRQITEITAQLRERSSRFAKGDFS